MRRSKPKPRKNNKVVPNVGVFDPFEPCPCERCKIAHIDRPEGPPAEWVRAAGYGEWNPKTKTYTISPDSPTQIDSKPSEGASGSFDPAADDMVNEGGPVND